MQPPQPEPLPLILLIDDDLDVLPQLAAWIRAQDIYRVVTARNGIEALEAVEQERPACAVVDMKMPLLDGNQFMSSIRGDPATASIPLIMLTARDKTEDRFAGLAYGADRYLTKPASPEAILAAIQFAIARTDDERARAQEALAHVEWGDL